MRLGSPYPSPIPARLAFGVPLEDVFPACYVHPRLQNFFAKALQTYREQEGDIEWVLRCGQGSIEERLTLKNQLVLSPNGHLESSAPGAYLWVIRHFLGLLPLPLFPSFTKGANFDWLLLSTGCRRAFKCHSLARDSLDTAIARFLNALPQENLRLIKMLICLLRRLAAKRIPEGKASLSRASLKALSCYFSGALFVRPFWPGGKDQDRFQPFLLYLIVRWNKIAMYCIATDQNLECYKPIYPANTSVKEIGCQTLSKDPYPAEQDTNNELYRLAFVDDDCANLETHFYTAQDFSFRSLLDEEKSQSWQSIVEETKRTVQKVEDAYIYDDYESFKREEFNQIGKPGSLLSRFMSVKASTPKNQSSESDISYIKFPDVCSVSCQNVIKTCEDKTVGQQLFEDNSPAAVQSSDSQQPLYSPKDKGQFRKISLHILRAFRPKTGAFQRQLGYMRIRSEEANNF
ncbi:uncharacterized protein LOC109533267 [Dendroctonus ponderosae]